MADFGEPGFPDIKRLKVPDSADIIVNGQPTATFLHFLNDLVKIPEALLAYTEPEAQVIPDQVLIQEQWTADGTVHATTDDIPDDNTIPQSNEGNLLQSLDFTPTETDSKIVVEWTGSVSGASNVIVALFLSSSTDAIDATIVYPVNATTARIQRVVLRTVLDSWGTSARTFRIRFGSTDVTHSNTVYIGSTRNGTDLLGGKMMSTLSVREYKNPA